MLGRLHCYTVVTTVDRSLKWQDTRRPSGLLPLPEHQVHLLGPDWQHSVGPPLRVFQVIKL